MDAQQTSPESATPRPVRWFSWLILGALGVFFARIVNGSSPLAFFDFFELLVTLPLFALHLLVMAPLVIQRGSRVNLELLFLAGALFGLHEAYITKGLWAPPGNPEVWQVGGVAALETLGLVFFWYPLMAFSVPLYTLDGLTGGQQTLPLLLPVKWLVRLQPRWMLLAAGVLCGLLLGARAGNIGLALLSSLSSALVIFLLALAWQRLAKQETNNLFDLLPERKEWRVLALLLIADYIVLGFVLRREALPELSGHIIIWALSLLLIGLFWLAKRRAEGGAPGQKHRTGAPVSVPFVFSRWSWLWFTGGMVLVSAPASLLPDWAQNGVYLTLQVAASAAGVWLLVRTILNIIKPGEIKFCLKKPK